MDGFKLDPHVHTCEVSPCGHVAAERMVQLYHEAGYAAVCVTDHYFSGFFEHQGDIPWAEKARRYCAGYYAARAAGERLGLQVLFGQEMRFTDHANDFLSYGLTPEEIAEYPELFRMTLCEFREFAHEHGAVVFQAHPFRTPPCAPSNPGFLDGVEVYNGHPEHDSRNHLALEFARTCGLRESSGSDFHREHHCARGGLLLERLPRDEKDFAAMLLKGDGIVSLLRSDEAGSGK